MSLWRNNIVPISQIQLWDNCFYLYIYLFIMGLCRYLCHKRFKDSLFLLPIQEAEEAALEGQMLVCLSDPNVKFHLSSFKCQHLPFENLIWKQVQKLIFYVNLNIVYTKPVLCGCIVYTCVVNMGLHTAWHFQCSVPHLSWAMIKI